MENNGKMNDDLDAQQLEIQVVAEEDDSIQKIFLPNTMTAAFCILQKSGLFNLDIWNTFVDNEIDDITLKKLQISHLEILIPKIGHQIKFEDERARWLKNPKEYIQQADQPNADQEEEHFLETPRNWEDELFDLESILKKFSKSSFMYKSYVQNVLNHNGVYRPLFRKERRVVVNTLMDWIILKYILLRPIDFFKIFEKIRQIFPKESCGLYYMPPKICDRKNPKQLGEPESSSDEEIDEETVSENDEVQLSRAKNSKFKKEKQSSCIEIEENFSSEDNHTPSSKQKPKVPKKKADRGTSSDDSREPATKRKSEKNLKKKTNRKKWNGPSGLLYSSYRYRLEKKRKELRENGVSVTAYYRNMNRAMREVSNEDEDDHVLTDEELQSLKKWLKYNFDPWETIKTNWIKTCGLRKKEMSMKKFSFTEFLEQWPRYTKPIGFELVVIDFDDSYPDSASNLKILWPQYTKTIIGVARKHAKEYKHNEKLAQLKINWKLKDDENNYIGWIAVNAVFYMCPGRAEGVNQKLSSFFRKVVKGSLISDEVQRISEELATLENKKLRKMNPFIIYYEDENKVPYKFFVIINHLIYETGNLTTALDVVFKSYFVFGFKYPLECSSTLTFIQQFFYKIFFDKDIESNIMNAFMCDIDPDRGDEILILKNRQV